MRTHTKFGIKKIFEIDMLVIFDLLTSPKGHHDDPRMKMVLAFVLLVISVDLICHMTMFEKKNCLTPWVPPSAHPWGMTQVTEWKSRLICFVSFICEKTHKIWYKNLWNWHGNRNLMIFDLWPHPKVTSLTLGWKFYLHSVLLVIPVDLIYHMTMFEKNFFWPLGTPSAPKSQP